MSAYVVLDLEMCKVPKFVRKEKQMPSQEIIQIGAVALNEDYQITDTFMSFVKPEYGRIDSQIQRLTGITPANVKSAPYIREVLVAFFEWLPDDTCLVTWSDNDVKQLAKEMKSKAIVASPLMTLFEEYLDCQEIFSEKMNTEKIYRLSEALIIADIDFDENIHDALVDARNTALLFAKTQIEEVLILSSYLVEEKDLERNKHGSFSNYSYLERYA